MTNREPWRVSTKNGLDSPSRPCSLIIDQAGVSVMLAQRVELRVKRPVRMGIIRTRR